MISKIIRDTGGRCSICGQRMTPPVNVEGTYWLCAECLLEKLEEGRAAGWRAGVEAMREVARKAWPDTMKQFEFDPIDDVADCLLAEGEGGKPK